MSRSLTIATRESPLALWQAEYVQAELRRAHPGLEVRLLGMTSRGDQLLDVPLAKVGGKGLFVKELEQEFGEEFLRVHRNALVALNHVLKLERSPGERWHVVLDGVDVRPVISRRHLAEAKQRLLQT